MREKILCIFCKKELKTTTCNVFLYDEDKYVPGIRPVEEEKAEYWKNGYVCKDCQEHLTERVKAYCKEEGEKSIETLPTRVDKIRQDCKYKEDKAIREAEELKKALKELDTISNLSELSDTTLEILSRWQPDYVDAPIYFQKALHKEQGV